jgi:hypothetical protein
MSEPDFADWAQFSQTFVAILVKSFRRSNPKLAEQVRELGRDVNDMRALDDFITAFCEIVPQRYVLIIDEVDRASDSPLFLSFLAMLRNKFLAQRQNEDTTFHSVVLAGVHDIKSLKLKVRVGGETKLNSPWNIATDFTVDLAFSPAEIASMLAEFAKERNLELEIAALSERIFYYSQGHPFLVCRLCKTIDEGGGEWTVAGIDWAFEKTTDPAYQTTNFDDLYKNLERHEDLAAVVRAIAIDGLSPQISTGNPVLNLGFTYGILAIRNNRVVIANRIYEQRIADYLHSKRETANLYEAGPIGDPLYTSGGNLHMDRVLRGFQDFMREHYADRDQQFLEREGRLVFMSFLKPILNGHGFLWKEPVVGDERRMDLVATYGSQKEVVELKIWRGPRYHKLGLAQLASYLDFQHLSRGYLLIFDFRKEKTVKTETISCDGKEIFAVWV